MKNKPYPALLRTSFLSNEKNVTKISWDYPFSTARRNNPKQYATLLLSLIQGPSADTLQKFKVKVKFVSLSVSSFFLTIQLHSLLPVHY
jgi:hypothetical protein